MYNRISGKPTKELRKQLDNNMMGTYMNDGIHDCVVKTVEVKAVGNADTVNSATVVLENSFGELHRENIFLWSMSDRDISYQMKKLLSCTADNPSTISSTLTDLMEEDWSVLDLVVGKSVVINLVRTEGYRINKTSEGISAILNGKTIGTFKDMDELKKCMDKQGIQRSYLHVEEFARPNLKEKKSGTTRKKQSFFDTGTCKSDTTNTSCTESVVPTRTRDVPSFKPFF